MKSRSPATRASRSAQRLGWGLDRSGDAEQTQQAFARRMLEWFDAHKRDLPWRRTKDPYAIWLSELMLQQTQVATVIAYYERFLQRFPTVHDLAAAPLDDVLRLWAGLGYYARARHLHAAAQCVVAEFGGTFPSNPEDLLKLPGVGSYTAGAVASIAFDRRAAMVDGNIARVLARLFAVRGPIKNPAEQQRLWSLAEMILPANRCGDFNQALMELGATICTPRAPQCPVCPVASFCEARRRGLENEIPLRTPARPVRQQSHIVVAIRCGDKYLFEARPASGLWAGLWQLPSRERRPNKSGVGIVRRLANSIVYGPEIVDRSPFARLDWQLTHRRVRFSIFRCTSNSTQLRYDARSTNTRRRWLSLERADELPLSTAMKNVIAILMGHTDSQNRVARSRAKASEFGVSA